MISYQQYLFETKVNLFCESYGFTNVNLITLMLENQYDLVNKIVSASDEEIKAKKVLNKEEIQAINNAYKSFYCEIEQKLEILNSNEEVPVENLSEKVFASQDLIKRIKSKSYEQIEQSTTMEALDKSPTDKFYF